jgi:rhamnulokinase
LQFNTLFQLEALSGSESGTLKIARDLLFIPDIFHYLLTGVKKTEFTYATTSQLLDPVTGEWCKVLLDELGVKPSLMQPIVKPGTVIGTLLPDIAAETGFPPVPVVAVATHDTASAVAAVPAEGKDWAYISSGTWSLVGIESDRPIVTDDSCRLNFTNEGGVDGRWRVLKNVMGLWLVQECRRTWGSAASGVPSYKVLEKTASEAPPFKSLIDPDSPMFLSPADMPAAITEFCKRTGQKPPEGKGAVIRCVLESLALKYRLVLDQVNTLSKNRKVRRIHIVGGGSLNTLLCQLTSDATGLPVSAGPVEATAAGNLLVQAISMGSIKNLGMLRDTVRRSFEIQIYTPCENRAVWDDAYRRFAAILKGRKS